MTFHPLAKKSLITASVLLALSVLIGAFGAHGLKSIVSADKLLTFETGVRYHFYHALGLLMLGLVQQTFQTLNLKVSAWAFLVGTLLFSFNCYFYVLSGMKIFAMIVPVGGVMFVLGWIMMTKEFLKLR